MENLITTAQRLTIDAGTSRLTYAEDQSAPDSASAGSGATGRADLRNLRVWLSQAAQSADDAQAGDIYWDVGRHYWRPAGDERYLEVPLFRLGPGSLAWSSPLWTLKALVGVTHCQHLGDEPVRQVSTRHYALAISTEAAQAGNSVALGFPALQTAEFPAHVWVDHDGLIRRVSRTWPKRLRRLLRSKQTWTTTELWDFGVSLADLEPPTT